MAQEGVTQVDISKSELHSDHIKPGFLATQHKGTGNKQHEIYMPNANRTLMYPTHTIFH